MSLCPDDWQMLFNIRSDEYTASVIEMRLETTDLFSKYTSLFGTGFKIDDAVDKTAEASGVHFDLRLVHIEL